MADSSHTSRREHLGQPPAAPGPADGDPTRLSFDPLNLGQSNGGSSASIRIGSSSRTTIPGQAQVPVHGQPGLEDDKTVISNRPPLAESLPPHPNTSHEVGRLLVGKVLGHFQLVRFVGGGGMGAVFEALDMRLARTVAVKVLARDGADEETIRRFKNEAQSAARLDHVHVARVFHIGEEDGWNYIVFEFVGGQNIRDLVAREGPLSLEACVAITLQMAEALEHAIAHDVVHRDIKPSNVIVSPQGRAKLVDMGLARMHQVESSNQDITASGVTLGTFDYISPEQARDPRSADVRSDLYSLGCTLYFMLTGRPPFPEGTVLQKLLSHSSDAVPDPRTLRRETPPDLAAILRKLTAKRPSDRYQTPAELIGELLLFASKQGLPCAQRGGTVWITPPESRLKAWERHLPWLAPIAILLLVVFAIDRGYSGRPGGGGENETAAAGESSGANGKPRGGKPPRPPGNPETSVRPAVPGDAKTKPATPSDAKRPPADNGARPSAGESTSGKPGDPAPPAAASTGGAKSSDVLSGELSGLLTQSQAVELSAGGGVGAGELTTRVAPEVSEGGVGRSWTSALAAERTGVSAELAERIIVDPTALPAADPRELVVASLDEAVRRAASLPSVSAVVLRFNGPRLASPFTLVNRRITFRAAKGFAPELVFRPGVAERRLHRGQMIRATGGELNFEGLLFRVELPHEPADDWALFSLVDVRSVRLFNCMLTISNHGQGRSALHQHAAFFAVENQAARSGMRMSDHPQIPAMAIDLWHSAARGEAALIRAEEIRPLRIFWGNGVFASTERMIELGGARSPAAADEHVRIDLSHVTAACDKGLLLAGSDDAAPHQMPINLRCHDCVLVVREGPMVEQQGASIDHLKSNLLVSGSGNFYYDISTFWKIQERAPSVRVETFDFNEWSRQWPNEKLPLRDVQWKSDLSALTDRPVSRHLAADYLLDDNPANTAATSAENRTPAGFQDELLPEFPSPQEPPPLVPPVKPEVDQAANFR